MRMHVKPKLNFKAAVAAGTAAGLLSGLVKLGWEDVLPPRTPARNATNPPQRLLEQLGVPAAVTHATYRYSDHDLPGVSYLIHFGFSVSFGVIYEVLSQNRRYLRVGDGALFGLAVWVAFHLGIMPLMGTVPSAKEQPFEEHLSEALGHVAWMWTNDLVGRELYRKLTRAHAQRD